MPAAMTHLAVARAFDADAGGLFYAGSLAPDYTDERIIKSKIHLRDVDDREKALRELQSGVDLKNTFELGWLLHLFADWRWDTSVIPSFSKEYTGEGSWFVAYRAEIGKLSHSMYHRENWSHEVWGQIDAEPVLEALREMRKVTAVLPVPLELDWYCARVERRHRYNENAMPEVFDADMALGFAAETAKLFKEWL